jgi:hypothetical protein
VFIYDFRFTGLDETEMQKKRTELSWGWISGVALGLGSAVGVAWESWALFFAVTTVVTLFMVWRAQRRTP